MFRIVEFIFFSLQIGYFWKLFCKKLNVQRMFLLLMWYFKESRRVCEGETCWSTCNIMQLGKTVATIRFFAIESMGKINDGTQCCWSQCSLSSVSLKSKARKDAKVVDAKKNFCFALHNFAFWRKVTKREKRKFRNSWKCWMQLLKRSATTSFHSGGRWVAFRLNSLW